MVGGAKSRAARLTSRRFQGGWGSKEHGRPSDEGQGFMCTYIYMHFHITQKHCQHKASSVIDVGCFGGLGREIRLVFSIGSGIELHFLGLHEELTRLKDVGHVP